MKKEIDNTQIDFSVLGNMAIPEIETTPLKAVKKKEQEEIRQEAIGEADSIEDFEKADTKPEGETTEETEEAELKEPSEDTDDKTGNEEISAIKGLALWAKEKKLINFEDDKFEDTEEWLENTLSAKVQKDLQAEIQTYKETLPEVIKTVLNNYEEGVPLDELIFSKSREIEYNNITEKQLEDNKELQKRIVSDWLYNQDYTEEEVNDTIKKYEDSLLLDDQSKIALKKNKLFEQKYQEGLQKAAQEKRDVQKEKYLIAVKNLEKEILTSEEIIPGIKLSQEERKKIFEARTKTDAKGKTPLTKAIENDPKAWDKITQFMVLMNGNLDSVKTKLTTQATQKVKETVNAIPAKNSTLEKINLTKIKKAIELSKRQTKI